MNLDETQKQQVSTWIEEGLKLSEIQGKLDSELGIRLTYMEVRFLIDDLSLKPQDPVEAPADPPADPPADAAGEGLPDAGDPTGLPSDPLSPDSEGSGGISLTVDRVMRPGSVVSGKVTFSDGVTAEWYLDQVGRLGLVPSTPGYKPSQDDVMAFQSRLQSELAKQGF